MTMMTGKGEPPPAVNAILVCFAGSGLWSVAVAGVVVSMTQRYVVSANTPKQRPDSRMPITQGCDWYRDLLLRVYLE